MATVVLVVHLMVAAVLVALVLLQRSEGGALGIGGGGGGGGGGFMSGRGTTNILTRATAVVAGIFFLTSISLTWLAHERAPTSILQGIDAPGQGTPGQGGILPSLQPSAPPPQEEPSEPSTPQVPQSQ